MTSDNGHCASLFIRGLVIEAEIGAWPQERGRRQPIRLDLDLTVADRGDASDDLAQVVCYAAVADRVRTVVARGHINLVERLAHEIAGDLLLDTRILAVRIRIEKPQAIANADAAGIVVRRSRSRAPAAASRRTGFPIDAQP
ncbi:dihydroneopterin aldolase [Azospirillum sp. B510]|uniref:dihydroneopterin aldolase n=1 Tax=Azospirillum sp. (strain B510) TaxID=137722 RepID=UPI0013053604|nr:dihydroneopterin aldolase [Azospirillum sp. B510]